MHTDFDKIISRQKSGSNKWDDAAALFGTPEVLPMWVADMDFAAPPPVIEALRARVEHGIFGYPSTNSHAFDAVADWLHSRHNWQTDSGWMVNTPGVVPAITTAIHAFTQPGDKIIIQPPVYPPFFSCVQNNDRTLVENPLVYQDKQYMMDYTDLEAKAKDAKMLILCSPHNPVGRVWTRSELEKVAKICLENNVLILADEIHSDLVYKGSHHIPLASLSSDLCNQIITCIAPSKTFNTAGLFTSVAIIASSNRRSQFAKTLQLLKLHESNIFGITALEAAYRHGGPWLDQLLVYLEGNAQYLADFVTEHIPAIKLDRPQATYLAWLDCRQLPIAPENLPAFFATKAKVGLNNGATFGQQGAGFMRLNFGCPRSLLTQGLEQIAQAVSTRLKFYS